MGEFVLWGNCGIRAEQKKSELMAVAGNISIWRHAIPNERNDVKLLYLIFLIRNDMSESWGLFCSNLFL